MPDPSDYSINPVACGLYKDILGGILAGGYPPHSVLPTELRLASDYGVSRSIVRSALDLLKRSGMVESRQGSGTVVADFEPQSLAELTRDVKLQELKDCFECRSAIEPEIAANVAANLSETAAAFLEEQFRDQGEEDTGTEYDRSVRDARFHIRLAELSNNAFFVPIMNQLRPHMLFAMNIAKTLTTPAQHRHISLSRMEHQDVISAILGRDPNAARDAMRDHIAKGSQRIFQDCESMSKAG